MGARRGRATLYLEKQAYDPQAGRPGIEIVTSSHDLVLSAAGALDGATVRETLKLPDVQTETTAALTVTLASRAAAPLASEARAPGADAVWFAFGAAHAASQREKDEALTARTTREQALARLGTTSGELFRAISVAAAFARLDAGTLPALEARAGEGADRLNTSRRGRRRPARDRRRRRRPRALARGGWPARPGRPAELLPRRPPSATLVAALVARAAKPAPADPNGGAALALGTARRGCSRPRAPPRRA